MSSFDQLITHVHELDDLGKASAVLYWDREVNMPTPVWRNASPR